jgi:hypothetical protein
MDHNHASTVALIPKFQPEAKVQDSNLLLGPEMLCIVRIDASVESRGCDTLGT